jgi:LacI family transcriptional regulator
MIEKMRIQDIARLAGVSVSTVSRVINKKPDVDPTTRERVLGIVKKHGFVPNNAASHLAGGRSRILGVIVPTLSWPFIPEIIRGVMLPTLKWPIIPEIMRGVTVTSGNASYELLLYSIDPGREHSDVIQRILSTQIISGLLAILPGDTGNELHLLHEHGLPMVSVDDQKEPTDIPWVGIDNRGGGYTAVRHLIRLGHRRIGHIRGPYACSEERYQGYLDALREAGIEPDPSLVQQGDFEVSGGHVCANKLFSLSEPPTAVFAGNDQMAYGVMGAAEQHGLSIPEDLAVVGFDDIPFSAHINPPLTTIRQPFFEMAQRAVELVIELIETPRSIETAPQQPLRIKLPTELIVRESCGAQLPRQRMA